MPSISISKEVTYNPSSKRICPSFWGFVGVTLFFIGVPTGIAIYLVLFLTPESKWDEPVSKILQPWEQILCCILMLISVTASIRKNLMTAWTDPGIIPRTKIEPDELVPNPTQDYFVSYMSED